jgi:hypothetical protein
MVIAEEVKTNSRVSSIPSITLGREDADGHPLFLRAGKTCYYSILLSEWVEVVGEPRKKSQVMALGTGISSEEHVKYCIENHEPVGILRHFRYANTTHKRLKEIADTYTQLQMHDTVSFYAGDNLRCTKTEVTCPNCKTQMTHEDFALYRYCMACDVENQVLYPKK